MSYLVLILSGGRWALEDLRILCSDEELRSLLQLKVMSSSDATGDWLRRMGACQNKAGGSAGLERVNRSMLRCILRRDERTDYTLDSDATQIVAEKRDAHTTYKGEKGYMPMVGHVTEPATWPAMSSVKETRFRRRRTSSSCMPANVTCPRARRSGLFAPRSCEYNTHINAIGNIGRVRLGSDKRPSRKRLPISSSGGRFFPVVVLGPAGMLNGRQLGQSP